MTTSRIVHERFENVSNSIPVNYGLELKQGQPWIPNVLGPTFFSLMTFSSCCFFKLLFKKSCSCTVRIKYHSLSPDVVTCWLDWQDVTPRKHDAPLWMVRFLIALNHPFLSTLLLWVVSSAIRCGTVPLWLTAVVFVDRGRASGISLPLSLLLLSGIKSNASHLFDFTCLQMRITINEPYLI